MRAPSNTVQINIEVLGNAKKSFDAISVSLRKAAGVANKLGSSFGSAAKKLKAATKETEKQIGLFKRLEKTVDAVRDSLKDAFDKSPDAVAKGFNAAFKSFQNTDIVKRVTKEALGNLGDESLDAFDKFFTTLRKSKFKKFSEGWKTFLGSMEDSFKVALTRMAAGVAQEIFLKPFVSVGKSILDQLTGLFKDAVLGPVTKLGKSALDAMAKLAKEAVLAPLAQLSTGLFENIGGIVKGIFGFAEGGLVKKPTLGVLGEAGPELVVPLAKIGGKRALQDLILGAELAKAGVGPTAFLIAA